MLLFKRKKISPSKKKVCEHGRTQHCKLCGDPIDITIKTMINCSKNKDKKKNRYDEKNFIDYDYVKNLIIESKNKCLHCKIEIQFIHFNRTLASIERLDNDKGHIKGNCVISCLKCNNERIGVRKTALIKSITLPDIYGILLRDDLYTDCSAKQMKEHINNLSNILNYMYERKIKD